MKLEKDLASNYALWLILTCLEGLCPMRFWKLTSKTAFEFIVRFYLQYPKAFFYQFLVSSLFSFSLSLAKNFVCTLSSRTLAGSFRFTFASFLQVTLYLSHNLYLLPLGLKSLKHSLSDHFYLRLFSCWLFQLLLLTFYLLFLPPQRRFNQVSRSHR